jgi:hypothetical protein
LKKKPLLLTDYPVIVAAASWLLCLWIRKAVLAGGSRGRRIPVCVRKDSQRYHPAGHVWVMFNFAEYVIGMT